MLLEVTGNSLERASKSTSRSSKSLQPHPDRCLPRTGLHRATSSSRTSLRATLRTGLRFCTGRRLKSRVESGLESLEGWEVARVH
jgi:hypothetical protein